MSVNGGIPATISQLPGFTQALGTSIVPVTQGMITGSLTLALMMTGYPSSTAIVGTETFTNLVGGTGTTLQKTSIAQIVTQATAAGNPGAGDLLFSTQSGNLRATALSAVASYRTYYTGGGTANAQTITLAPVPSTYYAGMLFTYLPTAANTGACTINVNGLGAKNIFAWGAATIGGEILTTIPATLLYDGTQFHLLNPNDATGSFTLIIATGLTTTPTVTVTWRIVRGKTVFVNISANTTGTSNASTMTGTGVPAAITPVTSKRISVMLEDAGIASTGWESVITGTSSTWTFAMNAAGSGGFTATGVKGIIQCQFSYTLD